MKNTPATGTPPIFDPVSKEAELRAGSRYSMPFLLNANPDCRMTCMPSCRGTGNPAKYPPICYAESQAVVLGE